MKFNDVVIICRRDVFESYQNDVVVNSLYFRRIISGPSFNVMTYMEAVVSGGGVIHSPLLSMYLKRVLRIKNSNTLRKTLSGCHNLLKRNFKAV